MAILFKTTFTFLVFALLQSCTGVFTTPRIETINNTRDTFSKTQSEIEMKFGEPEVRYKGFAYVFNQLKKS